MTFQFLCPQGHLLQGEEAHMGMQCQCPQCGVNFIIPTVERSQPSLGTESAVPAPAPQIDLPPLDHDDDLGAAGKAAGAGGLEGFDVGELDTGELDAAAVGETLLHIPCPNGHELEVPLDMVGQRAMCPQCNAEFRLRREKSAEYIRQQELIDRKRADFWFRLAIIVAGVVVVVLLIMFLAIMIS
ncbi:MAG: hypothetical protein WD063_00750 [Pirellulales bacterium]